VVLARGKPTECTECGKTGGSTRGYHWASLSRNYGDVFDYIRLCISCHRKMDNAIFNIKHMKEKLS
jgi:hypothetical protein